MLRMKLDEKKIWNVGIIGLNIIIFITLTISFFNQSTNDITPSDSYIILYFMNSVLAILAMIAVKTYHNLAKTNDLYILLLYFVNLAVELIIKFVLHCYISELDYKIFMASLFFRTFLIVILLLRNEFELKKIFKANKLNNIAFVSMTIIFITYDILNLGAKKIPTSLLQIISITIIIITVCSVFYNLKQSIKEDEILSSIISISFVFITVKLMYKLDRFLFKENYQGNNIIMEEVLMFLALVFMVFGTIVEIYKHTIKYRLIEERTNIYYKVIDENWSTNILIYSKGRLVYANRKTRETFNAGKVEIELDELQGRIDKVKSLENIQGLLESVQRRESTNKIIECTNGKVYAVSYQQVEPIYEENKIEDIEVYMSKEITEEIKSKKMLDITDKKFNILNDYLDEVVVVTDENLKITYINSYCEKLLKESCNEVINKDVKNYFEELNLDPRIEFKTRMKNSTGYLKDVFVKVEALDDYDEVRVGYIFVCLNKDMVEENKSNEDLLLENNIVKKDAFTNLSHELRTPIHIIYSSLQLLNSQKQNLSNEEFMDSFDKYEGVMKINSLRLLKLVNDIIDISKLDTGAVKINKNMYNIISLVENISMSVIPYMKIKNINFIFDTQEEERFIYCDQEKVERIVLNLISNAIKFTHEKGEINVFISVETEYVKISVRDNGIGIEKEKYNEIFERFAQCENGRATRKGSGIGLALVKSLVEMHNGYVFVESEFGKGSEFVVCLPNSTQEEHEGAMLSGENIDPELLGDISIEFSNIEA
ncbi:MAG: ATP-binding protein [Sarcina sp.]